jgi:CheY-like chemotaxis protein
MVFSAARLARLADQERARLGGAPRVLLVDDEADNLRAMAEILLPRFRMLTAADGRSALAAIAALGGPRGLAAVVTDQRMPGMSGLELMREVQGRWPGLPMLLVTGCLDVDAHGPVLRKPFDAEELMQAVARMTGAAS